MQGINDGWWKFWDDLGTTAQFLQDFDQMGDRNRQYQELMANDIINGRNNYSVQDDLNTYKLPQEALVSFQFIASTYFEFLGGAAAFSKIGQSAT